MAVIKIDSTTGSEGAYVCQCPGTNWGALGDKGGNPGVTRGTEGVEAGVGGTEVETTSEARVSRGSMVHWAITDQEQMRIGLRREVKGQVLGGAIVAKADSSREDSRAQVSQQGCQ